MNKITTKQIEMLEGYGFVYDTKTCTYMRKADVTKDGKSKGIYYVRIHHDKKGNEYLSVCMFYANGVALCTPTLEHIYNFTSLIDDKLNEIEVTGRGYNE